MSLSSYSTPGSNYPIGPTGNGPRATVAGTGKGNKLGFDPRSPRYAIDQKLSYISVGRRKSWPKKARAWPYVSLMAVHIAVIRGAATADGAQLCRSKGFWQSGQTLESFIERFLQTFQCARISAGLSKPAKLKAEMHKTKGSTSSHA